MAKGEKKYKEVKILEQTIKILIGKLDYFDQTLKDNDIDVQVDISRIVSILGSNNVDETCLLSTNFISLIDYFEKVSKKLNELNINPNDASIKSLNDCIKLLKGINSKKPNDIEILLNNIINNIGKATAAVNNIKPGKIEPKETEETEHLSWDGLVQKFICALKELEEHINNDFEKDTFDSRELNNFNLKIKEIIEKSSAENPTVDITDIRNFFEFSQNLFAKKGDILNVVNNFLSNKMTHYLLVDEVVLYEIISTLNEINQMGNTIEEGLESPVASNDTNSQPNNDGNNPKSRRIDDLELHDDTSIFGRIENFCNKHRWIPISVLIMSLITTAWLISESVKTKKSTHEEPCATDEVIEEILTSMPASVKTTQNVEEYTAPTPTLSFEKRQELASEAYVLSDENISLILGQLQECGIQKYSKKDIKEIIQGIATGEEDKINILRQLIEEALQNNKRVPLQRFYGGTDEFLQNRLQFLEDFTEALVNNTAEQFVYVLFNDFTSIIQDNNEWWNEAEESERKIYASVLLAYLKAAIKYYTSTHPGEKLIIEVNGETFNLAEMEEQEIEEFFDRAMGKSMILY